MSHSFKFPVRNERMLNKINPALQQAEMDAFASDHEELGVVFCQIILGTKGRLMLKGSYIPYEYANKIAAVLEDYAEEMRAAEEQDDILDDDIPF